MGQLTIVDGTRELCSLLSSYEAFVTYAPLHAEVPYAELVSLSEGVVYGIAPRASLVPEEEARNALRAVGKRKTALLIPGRRFDAQGARDGRGGGWYDRFLSKVPRAWLRIGFCYARQFSETPLVQNAWDEPMDVVCVVSDESAVRLYRV